MDYTWLTPFVAGLIRNISGWVQTSLEDGKITKYELGLLGKTLLEILVLTCVIYFALGSDVLQSSALAVLASYGISAAKKIGK